MEKGLVVFQDKRIRRVWHKDAWWFSIIDIVDALEASSRPRKYWSELRIKLENEGFEVSDIIGRLKLIAPDGKRRLTDCANTENMFRIIQSIPSKQAEPFKRWLAKVGYERIQEIENPELAQDRARDYYELKGYPKAWIEQRLRGIAIRQDLVGEWKQRGIEEKGFAILTNEISKATFDKTVEEYKEFKGLKRQNLRDHMSDWELLLTMIGDKATTDISIADDAQGLNGCKDAANAGGSIAKQTRAAIEERTGKSVLSDKNRLKRIG